MDSQVNSGESDGQEQKGKSCRKNGAHFGIFHVMPEQYDQKAVKNQAGHGMAAGIAVTSLSDQVQGKIRPGPLKDPFQSLVKKRGNEAGGGQRHTKMAPGLLKEEQRDADQGHGLPVSQIGNCRQHCGETFGPQAINPRAESLVQRRYTVPSDKESDHAKKQKSGTKQDRANADPAFPFRLI